MLSQKTSTSPVFFDSEHEKLYYANLSHGNFPWPFNIRLKSNVFFSIAPEELRCRVLGQSKQMSTGIILFRSNLLSRVKSPHLPST